MARTRSELQQPVAGLFSISRAERQRLALPVLRELRGVVAAGGRLVDLVKLPVGVPRECARAELARALLLINADLDQVDRWGDTTLRLWFVDRALRDCGALHRGGHYVTTRSRGAA